MSAGSEQGVQEVIFLIADLTQLEDSALAGFYFSIPTGEEGDLPPEKMAGPYPTKGDAEQAAIDFINSAITTFGPLEEELKLVSKTDKKAAAGGARMLVKKLDDRATIPAYQSAGAAGMDLTAVTNGPVTINPGKRVLIKTGLAVELGEGYELQIRSRSGLAAKHGVAVLNAPGTIDSDYRGEIGVILFNSGGEPFVVNTGDRIAQAVLASVIQASVEEVGELSDTERGEGGFGSTGVKS